MKQLNSAHDTIKYCFAIYYSKMTPEVYKWIQQTGTNRFCTHILTHCMIERYVPIQNLSYGIQVTNRTKKTGLVYELEL